MCVMTNISNPDSNDEFDLGESVNVTWNTIGNCTNSTRVQEIMLQRNVSGSWSNVATLFSGSANITSGSRSVNMPNSVPAYGDVYRLRVKYGTILGP